MLARAPGKLVLSGAYSVLHGAPAIVAAVDRYVVVDSKLPVSRVTEEVAEALRQGLVDAACGFDASELRMSLPDGTSRKLGLGSSAAILVATMAASQAAAPTSEGALGGRLFPAALRVHRAAQGGGSGVDVAASCFGGLLSCRLVEGDLVVRSHELPEVVFESWACTTSASTSAMLERVLALAASRPDAHANLIARARAGAEAAASATSAGGFVSALDEQNAALAELGDACGAPIVIEEVKRLDELAREEGARFYPAGAGGGDIALFLGQAGSSATFRRRASELGLERLELSFGAQGVTRG